MPDAGSPSGAGYGTWLANPRRVGADVEAQVVAPPPPVDLEQWATKNVTFGEESPVPGPIDFDRYPFWRRVLEVLGPEHPAREVVLKKSAQLGGTVIAQIFVGGSMDLTPGSILYVHPTIENATRWSKQKWKAFVRGTTALRSILPVDQRREGSNSILYQERIDGRGFLQISGANSEASLSMVSMRRQVQDDLSKWDVNEGGDSEAQADSRSSAFQDAKILKVGTPLIWPGCRITKNFRRSTQEHYHVPCPHCRHEQPLEWQNLLASFDPEKPDQAHFTCTSCGEPIEQRHRAWCIDPANGATWVPHNPGAEAIGFYIWSAYADFMTWLQIRRKWEKAKGDPAAEQTFLNDTVGEEYVTQGEAPPWEALRDRGEEGGHTLGRIPAGGLLVGIGVDCQSDRVEAHVISFGRNLRRWTVEYIVLPAPITDVATQKGLDDLLARTWTNAYGQKIAADMMAIDGNAFTNEVFAWVKKHPASRVIMVRGARGDDAPWLQLTKREHDKRGKPLKYSKRFYNVGVSPMKVALYKFLEVTDPTKRGYFGFPKGLADDFYQQITSETRVAIKGRDGYERWVWRKAPDVRNEVLDTCNYAEAVAWKLGWRHPDDHPIWARLEAEREVDAGPQQLDLEDLVAPAAGAAPKPAAADTSAAERMKRVLSSLPG